YKCMAIALVWSILFFFGFVWFANVRVLANLLGQEHFSPKWFAFLNAITHFLCVLLFVMIVPGAIDRSQSVFLIGYMGEHPNRTYSAADLQQKFIDTYVKADDAIGRRIYEQLATGTIVQEGDRYRLTDRGLRTLD